METAVSNENLLDSENGEVVLAFHENFTGRSKFVARYCNFVIFPDPDLEEVIEKEKLKGLSINTEVQIVDGQEGKKYGIAKIPKEKELRRKPFEQKPIAFVAIDGQNFLHSLQKLRQERYIKLDPLTTIESILKDFQCLEIVFFICSEGALQKGIITKKELADIKSSPNIILEDKEKKVIKFDPGETRSNRWGQSIDQYQKVDTDPLLIGRARDFLCQNPSVQNLVLFSGDSDMLDTVERWAGIGRYEKMGKREVTIISGLSELCKEMMEPSCEDNIHLSYLRDLV
jgi:hypothetical protein